MKSLMNSDAGKEVKARQKALAAGLPNEYYEEHDRERTRVFSDESAKRIKDIFRPDLKNED
jgi:hypothetical protein